MVYAIITSDIWQIERTKGLEVRAILAIHSEPHICVEGSKALWNFSNEAADVSTPVEAVPESAGLITTRALEEVKAFLHRYPSAAEASSRLTHPEIAFEVSYTIRKSIVTGEEWDRPGVPESGAGLLMQIDRHLNLESIWLLCLQNVGETADGYEIYENILDYLAKNQHCWDDDSLTSQNPHARLANREDGTKYR